MMSKKIKKLLKTFTLVELIIVIAIIAILSVAAFLVVTKWIGKSRDARRLSDVGMMVRSVTIYKSENGKVPLPSGNISTGTIVTSDGPQEFSYVGTFGNNTVGELDSLKKVPTDPMVEGQEYVYGVSENKKEFEVGVTLEGDEDSAYVDSVFAAREKAKVDGNYKPRKVILSGDILKIIPSLLFITGVNTEKILGGYNIGKLREKGVSFIVDGGYNKSYLVNGVNLTGEVQDKSLAIVIGNVNANFEGVDIKAISGSDTKTVLDEVYKVSGTQSEMNEIVKFLKDKGYNINDEGIEEEINNYNFKVQLTGEDIEEDTNPPTGWQTYWATNFDGEFDPVGQGVDKITINQNSGNFNTTEKFLGTHSYRLSSYSNRNNRLRLFIKREIYTNFDAFKIEYMVRTSGSHTVSFFPTFFGMGTNYEEGILTRYHTNGGNFKYGLCMSLSNCQKSIQEITSVPRKTRKVKFVKGLTYYLSFLFLIKVFRGDQLMTFYPGASPLLFL